MSTETSESTRHCAYTLTVNQPVGTQMLIGGKDVENRSWQYDREKNGSIIALHAGARWWGGPVSTRLGMKTASSTTKLEVAIGDYCGARWIGLPHDLYEVPTRAYIGAIEVLGFAEPAELVTEPWALGPQCWVLGRVWRLEEPWPELKGALGLWKTTEAARLHLEAVIEANPDGTRRSKYTPAIGKPEVEPVEIREDLNVFADGLMVMVVDTGASGDVLFEEWVQRLAAMAKVPTDWCGVGGLAVVLTLGDPAVVGKVADRLWNVSPPLSVTGKPMVRRL